MSQSARGQAPSAGRSRHRKNPVRRARRLLLLGRYRLQAVVEKGGAIPRQHLLEIRLQRAFALAQLLGPALLGGLAIFGSDFVGIDQRLRAGRCRRKDCDGGDEKELFQMSLRKSGMVARRAGALKSAVRYPAPARLHGSSGPAVRRAFRRLWNDLA